jgi:hypothetical protein
MELVPLQSKFFPPIFFCILKKGILAGTLQIKVFQRYINIFLGVLVV